MSIWLHTTILAAGIVATVAIASASIITVAPLAAKTDRLALVDSKTAYVTVETRSDRTSELRRVPVGAAE